MDRKSRKRETPRQYTAAEKAAVVADVAGLGLRGAGRRHGVPESTGLGFQTTEFRWSS